MKKRTILMGLLATVALWLPTCVCEGQNIIQQGDVLGDDVYTYGDASYIDEDDGTVVERTVNLKNFHAIQNNYSAKVCFTQSQRYEVKVRGTQKGVDMLDFSVKDGILNINVKKQYKKKYINIMKEVTLYISSPYMSSISNRGSLTLQGKTWKLDDLSIDNIGALTLDISTLNCKKLNITNRGSLRYVNGDVKATQANVTNSGAITLDLSVNAKEAFELSNRGSCKFDGKVSTKSYTESCQGASTDHLDIAADSLELNILGSSKINSTFKGKTATIHGGGASNILMDVDCDKLFIESRGSSKITVKGTADDTYFENHGVTNVDVTGLNKF